MASLIIHMCIAKEINKKLKIKDENMLILGSIAPDISKLVGHKRSYSHFSKENQSININLFLKKYQNNINNPFILGYFIHLYTDLLWEQVFMKSFIKNDKITLLDGTIIDDTKENYKKVVYNDYDNSNNSLMQKYKIDINSFIEKVKMPNLKMDEIDNDKLIILLDKFKFITNYKDGKLLLFTIKNAIEFITNSTNKILLEIKKIDRF